MLPGHGCKAQRHLPHAVPVDAVHHIWSPAILSLLLLLLLLLTLRQQMSCIVCNAMLLLRRLRCPGAVPYICCS